MIKVEELEAVPSQGVGRPEAWRWGLRHSPDTPRGRSGDMHGYIPSQRPIIHVFTARRYNLSYRLQAAKRGGLQEDGPGKAHRGSPGFPQDYCPLLALESVARELERAAVLRDRTDDIVRDTSGDLRVDLQRHPHRRPDEPDQVRDDLVRDLACVTPSTRWIECDRAVKAPGSGRRARCGRRDNRRR